MDIHIINGPNLNLLGKREPEIYGSQTFDDYLKELQQEFPMHTFHYLQSNHEGVLMDHLQAIGFDTVGILLNAGALTHYSYALADCLACIPAPVVEVHISNIYEREQFRKVSLVKEHCIHQITGHGLKGYAMGVKILEEF